MRTGFVKPLVELLICVQHPSQAVARNERPDSFRYLENSLVHTFSCMVKFDRDCLVSLSDPWRIDPPDAALIEIPERSWIGAILDFATRKTAVEELRDGVKLGTPGQLKLMAAQCAEKTADNENIIYQCCEIVGECINVLNDVNKLRHMKRLALRNLGMRAVVFFLLFYFLIYS